MNEVAKMRTAAIGFVLGLLAGGCAQSRSLPGETGLIRQGSSAAEILAAPRSQAPDVLLSVMPADSFYTCVTERRTVPLSEVTSIGFSADDVLAFAEGVHDMPLHWNEREGVQVEPSTRADRVIVVLERRAETARFLEQDQPVGHGAYCRSRFEIEVRITLRTEDGAFDETLDATLYAKDQAAGFVSARADSERLRGSLRAIKDADEPALPYDMNLAFAESGVTGVVAARWTSAFSSDIYDRSADLVHFGHARCPAGSYSVHMDDTVEGYAAQELVRDFDRIGTFAIDWMDGQSTTARKVWTAREPGACVRHSETLGKLAVDLDVAGELEVISEDGRLASRWPGTVGAQLLDSGDDVGAVRFWVGSVASRDPALVTPAQLGFPSIRSDGLEALSLTAYVGVAVSGDVTGSFELSGQREVCTRTSGSCQLEWTVVERGTAR